MGLDELTFSFSVATAVAGCMVAINLIRAAMTRLRKRKNTTETSSHSPHSSRQPHLSPPLTKEVHAAWLAAYENRVKFAAEAGKKTAKPRGWIYAYTFSSCQRDDRPYPIKVGQTRQSVEKRVHDQCKGTAVFERPMILGKWRSFDPRRDERAIHQELRRMGCNDTDGHGREWFHATQEDIERAVTKVMGN